MIEEKIQSLAQNVLNKNDIEEAEKLSIDIMLSKNTRSNAIKKIRDMTKGPKRPLYYCRLELSSLPNNTRNAIRYIGDYIDHLIKFLAAEKLNNPGNKTKSLGSNLNELKNKLPGPLYQNLLEYNKWIYVPAKHNFSVNGRKHLLTTRDVVFIYFISFKLKEDIVKISHYAKDYSEGKILEYY